MKKKREVKKTNTQKMWIGVGVVAVIAVALIVGLGALSIQPVEFQGAGLAKVKFFARDGTPVNASSLNLKLYVCNASGVENDSVVQYYSDFSNYEQVTLNSSYFIGFEFHYNILKDHVALLQINTTNYLEDWVVLRPGEQSILLNKLPDAIYSSFVPKSVNLSSQIVTGIITFHLARIEPLYIEFDHINNSLLGYIDDYELGKRLFLCLRINGDDAYTEKVLNLTNAETVIYNSDLYIRIGADLWQDNSFEFVLNCALIGNYDVSIGYVEEDDYSTFNEMYEIIEIK